MIQKMGGIDRRAIALKSNEGPFADFICNVDQRLQTTSARGFLSTSFRNKQKPKISLDDLYQRSTNSVLVADRYVAFISVLSQVIVSVPSSQQLIVKQQCAFAPSMSPVFWCHGELIFTYSYYLKGISERVFSSCWIIVSSA